MFCTWGKALPPGSGAERHQDARISVGVERSATHAPVVEAVRGEDETASVVSYDPCEVGRAVPPSGTWRDTLGSAVSWDRSTVAPSVSDLVAIHGWSGCAGESPRRVPTSPRYAARTRPT